MGEPENGVQVSRTGASQRVLLADDHLIVRQGLRVLLEKEHFDVVAEAVDGEEAVRLARTLHPDIAVLDLMMPRVNGLDAGREIVSTCPDTRVILLTMYTENHQIVAALRAGVRGYVVKTQAADDLIRAIRETARGGVYLSPGASKVVVEAYLATGEPPPDPLTPREHQVLQLISEGQTAKEIASRLGLTPKTAESYRTRIMEKLEIHDTAGLVRYAIRQGLVQP